MAGHTLRPLAITAVAATSLAVAACGSDATAPRQSTATPTASAPATAAPTQPPGTRPPSPTPLPAIVIAQPAAGSVVHSPLHVSGSADTFEAQFVLELRDAAGHVLSTQQVHATSGTGTRGTFDATVTFTARGPASLVAYERSAKDGSPANLTTVSITLA
jgi:hypothetical protein